MKYVLWLCVFAILAHTAHAYYADVVIDVNSQGLVSVTGTTDYKDALVQQSPDYTSKKGKYWLLNYSVPVTFDDLVYEVKLPKGAVVNYMKLPTLGAIEDKNGISISGATTNQHLAVTIQYKIVPHNSSSSTWMYILGLILVIAGISTIMLMKPKKTSGLDVSGYSKRQQEILILLQKNPDGLTQAQLEQKTGFPKSSLSRNIRSLQRNEVILKIDQGMTNLIKLK